MEVILRVKSGDGEAFSLLVDAYADRIFGYLNLMVKNRSDAEEISQEVFIKAYRGLCKFRADCPFAPWLFRIARNEAINFSRRHKRQGLLAADRNPDLPPLEPVDVSDGPLEQMLDRERRKEARRLIAALDEKYRTVLTLRYGEGLSYREIAGVIGAPEGTVKTLLHRAKAKLRRTATSELTVEAAPAG